MYKPINYFDTLSSVESLSDCELQDRLFRLELNAYAECIKHKLNSPLSIKAIVEMIVDELLNGDWDYHKYIVDKYRYATFNKTPQAEY